ncbi:response regulator transcription factor [Fictibacillus fluitans]|uniref:Response regulator transcription factor n=1 Tax=Fictibacillus fluitans TaxID=3058422 RepID=A0ABT8HTA9_9BACL|nr:response regulator transcription factor [Fictibacillus sp. NE201]MDN4523988.1 response regulator transcription factor [Fictibacillus sp. NE201]
MYNVLIVDDEPVIREGLKIIIPWEEYGFTVVDSASNGMDAIKKYEEHQGKVDLILADIQMPEMDGLQLIQEIRKSDPHIHFIILSGHADFSYAKKAIAWGVDDYILKPLDEDELISRLVKLKGVLSEEETRESTEARMEQLIVDLVTKDDISFQSEAEKLGLVWESYQVLLLKEVNHEEASQGQLQLKQFLGSYFAEQNRGVVFTFSSTIAILLNKRLTKNQNLKFLSTELKGITKEYGDYCIFAGFAEKELSFIKRSFEKARELAAQKFLYDQDVLVCPATPINPKLSALKTEEICSKKEYELVDKLVYALKIGNKDVVYKIIEHDILQLINGKDNEKSVKAKYIQFISSVLTKLMHMDSSLSWLEKEYPKQVDRIYHYTRFEQLETGMLDFFTMILNEMKTDTREVQMEKLLEFIHENYHKPLKLEMLADLFNYSSAYLGKIFKNATGESFNTYLDQVRIEKAKQLLRTDMKVYAVAESVGYTNVNYFFSKFKKYIGVSPTTFKKNKETAGRR